MGTYNIIQNGRFSPNAFISCVLISNQSLMSQGTLLLKLFAFASVELKWFRISFSMLQLNCSRMGILSSLGFCKFLNGNSSMLRFLHSSNSKFRFLGSNVDESYNYRTSQAISACSECRTGGLFARCRKPSSASQELFYSTHDSRIITCSASHNSKIILGSDAKGEILTSLGSKHHVTVIVFDLETTGFSRKKDRIIEIAFRDLRGGMNSSFQTLVNPEQIVPNSHVHGITTEMVNQPEVPRCVHFSQLRLCDIRFVITVSLIPIIGQYESEI